MDHYFGTYQEFETVSKNDGAALIGADNLVGDLYQIEIELNDGEHKAWLVNRFGKKIGFFNPAFSRKLSILKAQGYSLNAILSFVAYTDQPEPGRYWGEMAVICYDVAYEESFKTFIAGICKKISEGSRVQVDLKPSTVEDVINKNGNWTPSQTVPMPSKTKGTAIMKSKRSMSEKMIEQGRKGNKGCYVVSWLFLFALAALVVLGLRSCGVF